MKEENCARTLLPFFTRQEHIKMSPIVSLFQVVGFTLDYVLLRFNLLKFLLSRTDANNAKGRKEVSRQWRRDKRAKLINISSEGFAFLLQWSLLSKCAISVCNFFNESDADSSPKQWKSFVLPYNDISKQNLFFAIESNFLPSFWRIAKKTWQIGSSK